MPKKIRELVRDLKKAGWRLTPGKGKGSHRKFEHARVSYAVILSGNDGADAKPYQQKDVNGAVADAKEQK
jgi:predicted RNA binding protein YcfA (HicA-like mRNA interferase family)